MIGARRMSLPLRALGGHLGGDWERDRRDTLFLMGAILLSALPQFATLPLWASLAFVGMFAWRLGLLFSGRALPATWIRLVGAAACLGAVYAQYATLVGRDQGVLMLVLFLGLKLLEMKARRDLFVVLFLCFLLLLTSFFGSQSLVLALLSVVAIIALLAAMITMQYVGREAEVGRRLRQAAIIVLQAAPLALAMFVLFPRLATPLWGLSAGGGSASTGLSDSMAPGLVTSLAKSGATAFRVDFEGEAPAPANLYWRGPVFGYFDGRRWTRLHPGVLATNFDIQVSGKPVRYTVTLEPNNQPWLLALDMPVSLGDVPGGEISVDATLTPVWSIPVQNRVRYTAESYLQYTAEADADLADMNAWLRLPNGYNPRTIALGERWVDEFPDDQAADRVERALRMFRQQPFRYTLQPPALGRHSADDFLFETRAGFCEHYSSAFVILMRSMGIPARVVTGYQGAERNPVDGFYVVRQADAHAWAEVWLRGRGWVRVDPTAAVAPERIETSNRLHPDSSRDEFGRPVTKGLWTTFKVNLDAVTHRWNQWVLQFDRGTQKRLIDRLGLAGDDWRTLAALLALAMVIATGLSALIALKNRPQRDPIGDAYHGFCSKLALLGHNRAPHETAAGFLSRIASRLDPKSRAQAQQIVGLYNRLRYGELSNPRSVRERRVRNIGDRKGPGEARKIIHANEGLRRLRSAVRAFQPGKTPVER
ncbi:MAG: DUF3488 and transglutaminase-like domain-containing protein [Burkholderiaceae bacterium]